MQHEIDHLDGMLFIFRMSALKRDLNLRKIAKCSAKASGSDARRSMTTSILRHSQLRRAHPEALIAAGHEIALSSRSPTVPSAVPSNSPPRRQASRSRCRPPVTQPEKIRNNAEFRAQLESISPEAIVL